MGCHTFVTFRSRFCSARLREGKIGQDARFGSQGGHLPRSVSRPFFYLTLSRMGACFDPLRENEHVEAGQIVALLRVTHRQKLFFGESPKRAPGVGCALPRTALLFPGEPVFEAVHKGEPACLDDVIGDSDRAPTLVTVGAGNKHACLCRCAVVAIDDAHFIILQPHIGDSGIMR